MHPFEQNLEKYAELAIKVGINLQKGQKLVIVAPISCADFVRKAALKAYEAGALDVYVDWEDDQLKKIRFHHAPDEAFELYPMWKANGFEELAKENAAFLTVYAPNAELYKDVKAERLTTANKTASAANQAYKDYMRSGKVSWLMVSIPTPEWSAKVFPEMDEQERIDRLWEQIFKLTRVDADNPVEAWRAHIADLVKKQQLLNGKRYHKLHLKAPGTSLSVELPEKHQWVSAGMTNAKGDYFVPNLPTEEVFTLPVKEGVNGTVTSTKPLSYNGSLIDNFAFTFINGRITEVHAEQGEEILRKLLDVDAGTRYLGEIALVPHDSPISNSNLIFYNTLFDENASCHLAIGSAYPFCIEGGTEMSKEELEANGYNTSLLHIDFMIGSPDMEIDGETRDGIREPLFRKGNWVV